ncbi:MAG: YqeG family HAD IIIA-type phosphatase [Oscillospiraceae bacterium]|nr:YqeG family HAD IIIA-type phosphatase [Oscillospiraceae bacterium]
MLRATVAVRSVCDITPALLRQMGVKGLLLDIDNTLTTHDNPDPAPGVMAWIGRMREAGIEMRLVSNNHPPRVEPFSGRIGIPCICDAAKPLRDGYRRAAADMGLDRSCVCAVGDQLYTDILGANCFGIRSIYVQPMERETWKGHVFIRIKRILEIPFLPRIFFKEES